MLTQIKSWLNNSVLFECECNSISECVKKALESNTDLSYADLSYSNLTHACLPHANMYCSNLSRSHIDDKYFFLSIFTIGSENGCLWAIIDNNGVLKINRGCFSGSLPEFKSAVITKHIGTKYADQYFSAIELIKTVLGVDNNGFKI